MGVPKPAKTNGNRFSKLAKASLNFSRDLVFLVGRPFYFFLLAIVVLLTMIVMVTESVFTEKGVVSVIFKIIFFIVSTLFNLLVIVSKQLVKSLLRFLKKISRHTRQIDFPVTTVVKSLAETFTFAFVMTLLIGLPGWHFIFKDLPSPRQLSSYNFRVTSKIYDRNGVLLYKIYKDENRTPVKLESLPKIVILSTLAAEDNEFYQHYGISIKGIVRALVKDIRENKMEGGSTITQQLVKNTLLTPEKSIVRKLKEVVLAIQVESIYSKNEILQMYLNQIPYGGTEYGIQEAAQRYFNKNATDLTLTEASLLSALPKSPTKLSPYTDNPTNLLNRQKEILRSMLENSYISQGDYQKAYSEKLIFFKPQNPILAPHFVIFVRDLLEKKYGNKVLEAGGLEITTTLDLNIQAMVDSEINLELKKLTNYHVTNAAVIVANPKNGDILAMAGSKDFFNSDEDGQVNIVTSLQQPGSSIKIINYAYALGHGYQASTTINDAPITFSFKGSPPYSPKNYDGIFKGNLTLRSAFAQSRNIPAVKVLASYGVDKMIDLGREMGITTWTNPKNYGLSLTLGGGDIKLIDLAQVYSVVANYGNKVDFNPIEKITDNQNNVVKKKVTASVKQIIDPRVAFILTDILKDNKARTPAFGQNSLLNIPAHKEVAVKTGTSNNLRDNLTIGYNQNYLVAVWVGNNDNSPMARVASGVTGATPIFNRIMTKLLENTTNHSWEVPNGLKKTIICFLYKKPDSEEVVVNKFTEWFLQEDGVVTGCNIKPPHE